MTTDPTISLVVSGSLAAVEAEYGLPNMGDEWFARWGFTHVIKIIAEGEYDCEFFGCEAEADVEAKALAAHFNVPWNGL